MNYLSSAFGSLSSAFASTHSTQPVIPDQTAPDPTEHAIISQFNAYLLTHSQSTIAKSTYECALEYSDKLGFLDLLALGLHYEKKYNSALINFSDDNLKIALLFFRKAKDQGSIDGKIGILRIIANLAGTSHAYTPEKTSNASYKLGLLYLKRLTGKPGELNTNSMLAENYLKKAAEANHGLAALTLARLYSDHQSAFHAEHAEIENYFFIAIKQGIPDAQEELGAYVQRIGVAPEYWHDYLIKLADNGYTRASFELAKNYLDAPWQMINLNEHNARRFLKKVISNKNSVETRTVWAVDLFLLGKTYSKNGHSEKAWLCYEAAGELGLLSAIHMISMLKAEQGNVEEMFRFGALCFDKKVSTIVLPDSIKLEDYTLKGYQYLLQAADKGHGAAALKVAMYMVSRGNTQLDETIERYFKIAVKHHIDGARKAYEAFKMNQLKAKDTDVDSANTQKPVKTFSTHEDL